MLSQSLHGSYMTKLGMQACKRSGHERNKIKGSAGGSRQAEYPGSSGLYASAQPRGSKHQDKYAFLQMAQQPISPKDLKQREESARGYQIASKHANAMSGEGCMPHHNAESLRPKSRATTHTGKRGGTVSKTATTDGGARSSVVSASGKQINEEGSPRVRLSEPDLVNAEINMKNNVRLGSQ